MRRRAFSFSVPPNFIPHGGLRGAGLCANMMRKHKQNPYEEVPMKKILSLLLAAALTLSLAACGGPKDAPGGADRKSVV